MAQLATILQGDRTDFELIQLALETLANIMTFEPTNDEGKRRIYPMIIIDRICSRTTEFTSGHHRSIYR